ncbi:MAG: glycosyltransferase family 4 protein [Muribaculum sp.]|nr:glycosyltransferase family 4 protein [Muribaculum sp.]
MRNKFCILVGNPKAFKGFFEGQLKYLSQEFSIVGIANSSISSDLVNREEGIPIINVNIERKISIFKDIISLIQLCLVFIKIRPRIVHTNTPKVSLIGMLASFLTIVPVRIYVCHGIRYQGASGRFKSLLKAMEKITCKLATHIICVSKSVQDKLISDGMASKTKTHIINNGSINGVNPNLLCKMASSSECISLKKRISFSSDDFVFCYVGRLVKDKGINELIIAFKRIIEEGRKAKLLLVGPLEYEIDPLREETINYINNNENIHITGWIDDISPYMYLSDIIVLPSYREGLSTTLLEAGALGKPSITTTAIGCKDVITDGYNGIIIPNSIDTSENICINGLYDAMIWAMSQDKAILYKMGLNAKQFVRDNFNRNDIWRESLKFYKSL